MVDRGHLDEEIEKYNWFLIIVTTVFLNFGLVEINMVSRYCFKIGYTLVLNQCKLSLVAAL